MDGTDILRFLKLPVSGNLSGQTTPRAVAIDHAPGELDRQIVAAQIATARPASLISPASNRQ